jgi:hypothetical protein
MRNFLLLAIWLLASSQSHADEDYLLYRITCNKAIPSFQVEKYTYWNIRHVIWPKRSDWAAHVAALQRLEREESLYVLHELYGYYSESQLEWTCGGIEAVLTFDKLRREHPGGSEFPPVFVRSAPRLSAWFKGKQIIADLPVAPYTLRTYADYQGAPYIAICSGEGVCKDELASTWAPVTRQHVDAMLTNADR